jgi:hypothetical protein
MPSGGGGRSEIWRRLAVRTSCARITLGRKGSNHLILNHFGVNHLVHWALF